MKFRCLPLSDVDWESVDHYDDRSLEQTQPWLNYLQAIGAGTPIVAALEDGGEIAGYFTGFRKRVYGVPVLGAPLKGWNSTYLGFNLKPNTSRTDALRTLVRFTVQDLRCAYVEVSDVHRDLASARNAGFATEQLIGYVSDLSLSEDELFGRMTSACRRCIRKAEKTGVVVEEAEPTGFAEEFYSQLESVYARQGLKPTIPAHRVRLLIKHVHPSGKLLLLRARSPEGISIATGIFYGHGKYSGFWGNGSIRDMLHFRPNQAMHWYAMRYWKARGVRWHHWGGGGTYKESYGPEPFFYLRQFWSVVPGLAYIRKPALSAYYRFMDWRASA